MKILCSAQSFGYGPCSKLVTFIKHLRKIYQNNLKIDFIGNDIALIYAIQNSKCFNNIFKCWKEYPNLKDYDVVVSVMNPYPVILGWLQRKKVLYIDSLFWFWKWDEKNFKYIEGIIQKLRSINSFKETKLLLKKVDDHHLQYIAHRVSSVSCVQKFFHQKTKTFNDIFRRNISNLIEVGPIIDTSFRRKESTRNKMLISLGGLYSPLVRFKEGISYANFILNLLNNFIEKLPKNIEIILTSNPEITSNIISKNNKLAITSLNHEQFLDTLNKSVILFTPPSITTIYEALFYNVPVIFLPEQHDGHFPNFLRLSSNNKIPLFRLRKIFPELLFTPRLKLTPNKNPAKEILRIQRLIKKFSLSFNNPVILDMKETLKKCLILVIDDKKRNKLLHQQQKIVLKKINVLDRETVKNLMEKLLD